MTPNLDNAQCRLQCFFLLHTTDHFFPFSLILFARRTDKLTQIASNKRFNPFTDAIMFIRQSVYQIRYYLLFTFL
jgi:hypothetical protein